MKNKNLKREGTLMDPLRKKTNQKDPKITVKL